MPFKFKLFLVLLLSLFLNMYIGAKPSNVYQSGIQKTSFQNRSFLNTKDFANSSLGPTFSAKQANPGLYSSPKILGGGGGGMPPPPPPLPLDNGFIVLIGGILVTGFWYLLKKFRLKPNV